MSEARFVTHLRCCFYWWWRQSGARRSLALANPGSRKNREFSRFWGRKLAPTRKKSSNRRSLCRNSLEF
jgi:hypothetical protein